MFVIKNKKIFIGISITLVVLSIISLSVFGLKMGIDFKGGSITEVAYENERPDQTLLNADIQTLNLGSVLLQPAGELSYIVKTGDITEEQHFLLLDVLSMDGKYKLTESNFNSIGPSVGKELSRKALFAIAFSSLVIVLFIAFAFRKVSKPVSSWKYGIIAIIALLHDIIITAGVFSLVSKFYGIEADSLFVVAVLTIVGLSISDTIVIFDRIRENLRKDEDKHKLDFHTMVGKSLNQSFERSLLTSFTTILVLLCLFFFGPESTKYFALMLTVGMFFGTYSSIFFASPMLVLLEEKQKKNH